LPHAVIIHTTNSAAFLVLLSAKYAMRTWRATVVSAPHTGEYDEGGGQSGEGGDVDSSYRFRRWVFNKQATWEWMSVWNVEEWLYQPTTWCTLTDCQDVAPPANFGHLGCRATGKAVPLLAEALVRDGRTVEARAKFVKASEGVDTVLECLQKILQDYPESSREEYVLRWKPVEAARWERAKKRARRKKARLNDEETMDVSESNPEEVPEMMANLSTVALEGMGPDNSKELEKDMKNLQQVERQRAKRYMRNGVRAWAPVPGPESIGAT
jgi:hypothetical protein